MLGVFLVQGCLIRYLYTKVWTNVGITHDAFWTHWVKVFNVTLTIWFFANSVLSNEWYFQMELAICMNVESEDIPSIMGKKARL